MQSLVFNMLLSSIGQFVTVESSENELDDRVIVLILAIVESALLSDKAPLVIDSTE